MSPSSILVLAAGASRRMGQPKQALALGGSSLLGHAVQEALLTRASEVIVITGAAREQSLPELSGFPVCVVHNPNWQGGMGSSIRAGMAAISPHSTAVLITTCDQPFVCSASLDAILTKLEANPQSNAVAAAYANVLGVPAVFRDSLFDELANLQAEEGARQVLKRHPAQILPFSLPEAEFDIDTPAQYQALALQGIAS